MKISVFGLGYVGAVSVAGLAALGHEVIGVDVNAMKVDVINAGSSPVIEAGLESLIAEGVRSGRIRAVTRADTAIGASDLSLVCVGTPSGDNGNQDLTFLDRACKEIGEALRTKEGRHSIAVRSTILPGTMEGRIIPALEQASGLRADRDFGIAFNPEFLREGTALQDFNHPPFTIVGQRDRGETALLRLYESIEAPLYVVPVQVAEMVKYASNAFHALKITFANEIGSFCKRQGIDSHEVMEIFRKDVKLNVSPYYLEPGFAFGGSCLHKDLAALLYQAHHLDLHLPVLEAVLPSNELQIKHGYELVRQTGCKRVGMLGLSFKAGTDDLRNSPLVELVEVLVGKGYQVKVYDKNVSLLRLHGSNRAFIEREIPHIASLMCDSLEQVVAESQVIVVGNKAPEFCAALSRVRPGQIVVDLARVQRDAVSPGVSYQGICW